MQPDLPLLGQLDAAATICTKLHLHLFSRCNVPMREGLYWSVISCRSVTGSRILPFCFTATTPGTFPQALPSRRPFHFIPQQGGKTRVATANSILSQNTYTTLGQHGPRHGSTHTLTSAHNFTHLPSNTWLLY